MKGKLPQGVGMGVTFLSEVHLDAVPHVDLAAGKSEHVCGVSEPCGLACAPIAGFTCAPGLR